MTIPEQIITQIFQSQTPDCLKNIKTTFEAFSGFVDWEQFRRVLVEYRFEVPKTPKLASSTKARDSRDKRTLEFARENGGTFSKQDLHKVFAREIQEHVHPLISGILNRLLKSGKIERIGWGKYQTTHKNETHDIATTVGRILPVKDAGQEQVFLAVNGI